MSAAPPPFSIPIPPNIASLTIPPLLGIMLNWGLFGALAVQVYIYSLNFPDDRKWIKWIVYGLFILETAQTALATADAVQWFAVGFGDMISLSKPEFSTIDAPILDAIIALIVQYVFCWRIRVLSESWVLSGGIGLVALAQLVGALGSGIREAQLGDLTKMRTITVWVAVWFGGSALADTLIAIAMITLLLRRGKDASHGKDLVRRLVRMTIETNSLTAVVAIVGFILSLTSPGTSLNMTPAYALGKLYSNSLLVVFNNRIFLARAREGATSGFDDGSHSQNRPTPRMTATNHTSGTNPNQYVIKIVTETNVESDMMELDDRNSQIKHGDASLNV